MLRIAVMVVAMLTSISVFSAGHYTKQERLESIGRVILSIGENYADPRDGEERKLKRGSLVYPYERVMTSERGRLHIRFNDGSSINLKPRSSIQIAQYRYDDAEPEKGTAVFQLLRGGLRTISGKIGKSNPENYRFQSALATIGIRGTEYELYLCDRCCATKNKLTEGIAGGVDKGGIYVDTNAGSADLSPGKYFELAKGAKTLQLLDERPDMLKVGDEPRPVLPKPKKVEPAVQCDSDLINYGDVESWIRCDSLGLVNG